PTPAAPLPKPPSSAVSGSAAVGWWLFLRAFASGCTAMTGVEAVSNGVPLFREPSVVMARRTLTSIVIILIYLLAGLAVLATAYGIQATTPGEARYESIVSQVITALAGHGVFYFITMASVLAVL